MSGQSRPLSPLSYTPISYYWATVAWCQPSRFAQLAGVVIVYSFYFTTTVVLQRLLPLGFCPRKSITGRLAKYRPLRILVANVGSPPSPSIHLRGMLRLTFLRQLRFRQIVVLCIPYPHLVASRPSLFSHGYISVCTILRGKAKTDSFPLRR